MKKDIIEILNKAKNTKESFSVIANRFKGTVPLIPELLKAIGDNIPQKASLQESTNGTDDNKFITPLVLTEVISQIPSSPQNVKVVTLDITAAQLRDSVFTPILVENFETPFISFVTALAFRTPISVGINQGSGQSSFDITCGNMNILNIGTSSTNRWERGYHVTNMNAAVSPYNSQSTLTIQASGDLLGTTGGGNVKLVIGYIAIPV